MDKAVKTLFAPFRPLQPGGIFLNARFCTELVPGMVLLQDFRPHVQELVDRGFATAPVWPKEMFAQAFAPSPYLLTGDPTLAQLYLGFSGRLSRRAFWLHGVLGLTIFSLVAMALFEIAGLPPERAEATANLLIVWPLLAISAKRWHDRDLSGWLALLLLLPLVGQVIALVVNGFLPGTPGENRFGPAPAR